MKGLTAREVIIQVVERANFEEGERREAKYCPCPMNKNLKISNPWTIEERIREKERSSEQMCKI